MLVNSIPGNSWPGKNEDPSTQNNNEGANARLDYWKMSGQQKPWKTKVARWTAI